MIIFPILIQQRVVSKLSTVLTLVRGKAVIHTQGPPDGVCTRPPRLVTNREEHGRARLCDLYAVPV